MVTNNQCFGVRLVQAFEQGSHRGSLLRRPCVGGMASRIEASLVADAYRVAVMPLAVCADDCLAATWLYAPVTTDDVVVADALPATGFVPLVYLLCGTGLRGLHGTAMDDN